MEDAAATPKPAAHTGLRQSLKENITNSDVKIAIVDDSDFSRQALAQILQAEGFTVVASVKSASAALVQLEANPCHICLIDVVMAEMSGLDLAKHVHDTFSDVQIIMMSSLRTDAMVIDSIATGALDYLQKPFTKEDLLKSIYAAIDNLQKQSFR
ncbi:MAG: response regulator [Bacteriovoracaceae bacterium]|nr:response regulator [Bacteriovoracaceae bacterium]